MEENNSGFHPARGCIARLKEHQEKIDTDFREMRARFAKGFPAKGSIPAVSLTALNAILAESIETAPARLRELQQQLADCLAWELQRHGPHICAGYEVSENTIQDLYTEINQEVTHGPQTCLTQTETSAVHQLHERLR